MFYLYSESETDYRSSLPDENLFSSHGHEGCCFSLYSVCSLHLSSSTRSCPARATDVLHPTETVTARQQHPITMQLQTVSCAGLMSRAKDE